MSINKGAVYIAFGQLYLAMALFSVRTLRARNRDLPVMIITNVPVDFSNFDFLSNARDILKIIDLDEEFNRQIKTNLYSYVPFDYAVYIDADTYVVGDLSNCWKFLDYFDVALKLNAKKQKKAGKGDQLILGNSAYVRDLPHFNSGVIFFKKSCESKRFFSHWFKAFSKGNIPYDQVSLVEALFESNVRILPLTEDWNYFPDGSYYAGKVCSPSIIHYTNRISYTLEDELLKIIETLGFDRNFIKEKINIKRLQRRKKIGLFQWMKMVFYWKYAYENERKKWGDLS